MTGAEATRRLQSIKPEQWQLLDALAQDILRESRDPILALGAQAATGAGPDLTKALYVLQKLDELGVPAWHRLLASPDLLLKARAVRGAADAYLAAERRVRSVLEKQLGSKTLLPKPKSPEPSEETRPKTRECDEAYMLLRRWLKTDDSTEDAVFAERAFLRLEDRQRDAAIEKFLKNNEFIALAEEP